MTTFAGLGTLLLNFIKTLIIDSIVKVFLYPEEIYVPEIRLGGPMLNKAL